MKNIKISFNGSVSEKKNFFLKQLLIYKINHFLFKSSLVKMALLNGRECGVSRIEYNGWH